MFITHLYQPLRKSILKTKDEESMSEKKIKRSNVTPLWANNYPEVTRWLGRLQKKDISAWFLWRFCMWAKKTPTELLALKDNPSDRTAEKLLDDFVNAETLRVYKSS